MQLHPGRQESSSRVRSLLTHITNENSVYLGAPLQYLPKHLCELERSTAEVGCF